MKRENTQICWSNEGGSDFAYPLPHSAGGATVSPGFAKYRSALVWETCWKQPYSIQKLVLYKKQYLHNKAKATFWLCLLVELDKEHVSFYSYI